MTTSWKDRWRSTLITQFSRAVVDFYPYNMLDKDVKHLYLVRMRKAIQELEAPQASFHFKPTPANTPEGRYAHLQLTPEMWQTLEENGDLPTDRHAFFTNDKWQDRCLDEHLAEEWNLKTHWKIVLTGTRARGMFNHSDSLLTSSWHAHVIGRKRWRVCGEFNNGTQACYEETLKSGQILYYPPAWHHATRILDTPTVTLTDTIMNARNAEGILDKVFGECTGSAPLRFDLSAKLCDVILTCVSEHWRSIADERGIKWGGKTQNWRDAADPERVATLEAIMPWHNNYDGRNFITE